MEQALEPSWDTGTWRWMPQSTPASPPDPAAHPGKTPALSTSPGLTGVQLEHQLDRVVVEVAAVLDDLDEGGQAALHCRHLRHGHGGVELPEN